MKRKFTIIFLIVFIFSLVGYAAAGPTEVTDAVRVRSRGREYTYLGRDDSFFELKAVDVEGVGGQGALHILHVIGNEEEEDFKVTTFDENKEKVRTLIDTDRKYGGIVGQNFHRGEDPKYLQVQAEGEWDIGQFLLGSAPDQLLGIRDSANFDSDSVVLIGPDIEEDKEAYINTSSKAKVKTWGSEIVHFDTNNAINSETFTIKGSDQAIEVRTPAGNDVHLEILGRAN
ncbi:hypothetical protein [Halarsenatibacter silvermanii]|uniref:Curlin associated repeat-containing protein n=1 Tax=Halarsenatibacter silvermanii TaxID=321763 RepID=A0A1G9U4R4_9FIRM|nr:hypothetical protein [Halarsenatibacter silvermanii]SDM54901.1 hypothetical protein SAMN04488692_1582 [Halarsenatibacter silvermanii]